MLLSPDDTPFHQSYHTSHVCSEPSSALSAFCSSARSPNSTASPRTREDFSSGSYVSDRLSKSNYSDLAYMMAIDYETYLVDDILQKVDRATMTASLEGREPYLDHRIIEWAARLPDQYKYNNGVKKYILREIVYDYIPKTMMDRPKMGFAIPIGKWLKTELRNWLWII